jgi:hypothetical protein
MAVSKRTRFEVLRRDDHTCRYCGGKSPDVTLTVDHVVPVSLGGADDPTNLVAACKDCNAGKSSSHPDAPMVAQVADDAVKWAAAMRQAMASMESDVEAERAYERAFLAEWNRWTVAGENVPLPSGWISTLDYWRQMGVSTTVLARAIDLAFGNDGIRSDRAFKYMCGIVWRKVDEAKAAVKVPAPREAQADSEPNECGHCGGCTYNAANPEDPDPLDCFGTYPIEEGDETCPHCGSATCFYLYGKRDGDADGFQEGAARGKEWGRDEARKWFLADLRSRKALEYVTDTGGLSPGHCMVFWDDAAECQRQMRQAEKEGTLAEFLESAEVPF